MHQTLSKPAAASSSRIIRVDRGEARRRSAAPKISEVFCEAKYIKLIILSSFWDDELRVRRGKREGAGNGALRR